MHVKELQAHNFGKTHNLGVLGVLRIWAIFMWPLAPTTNHSQTQRDAKG
jgi:hypothetical protein